MRKRQWLVFMITIFLIVAFQFGAVAKELVVSYKDGQNYCLGIFVEGGYHELLSSKTISYYSPRLSKDGKKILYHTPAKEVWIINSDGTDNRSLFRLDYYFGYSWSSDPNEILVGSNGKLAIFNLQTNSWRTIVENSQYNFTSFDLAPDGRKIVFSQFNGIKGLYTFDLLTEKIDLLYKSDGAFLPNPRWSPDEKSIVYVYHQKSFFGEKVEIHVLDVKAKQSTLIVKGLKRAVDELRWIARTNEIVFVSGFTEKDDTNIFLLRPDGRHFRIFERTREVESGLDW